MILIGDCVTRMAGMEPDSVDAVVTDPPYHLTDVSRNGSPRVPGTGPAGRHRIGERGFMGKVWDGGGIAFDPATWAACCRVLKPGGRLLAFGAPRTHHRIWTAIEDAGFVIEDTVMWLFGQGFPKHKSKLKPAYEPIVVARKGPVTALNIDAARIAVRDEGYARNCPADRGHEQNRTRASGFKLTSGRASDGRWPANVVLDEAAAAALDAMSGTLTSGANPSRRGSDKFRATYAPFKGERDCTPVRGEDSGGASRFFFCAKAPSNQRWGILICDCKTFTFWSWESVDLKPPVPMGSMSRRRATSAAISGVGFDLLTPLFGNEHTAPFHVDSKSTTSTETSRTTGSITSGLSVPPNTSASTEDANSGQACGGNRVASAEPSSPSIPTTGISQSRDGRYTGVVGPVTFLKSFTKSVCEDCGAKYRLVSHPTQKPLALMRWLVRLVTQPGDLVLDPFAGSGTTGMACKAEGRRFIGCELDPEYAEIARRRIAATEVEGQQEMFLSAPQLKREEA